MKKNLIYFYVLNELDLGAVRRGRERRGEGKGGWWALQARWLVTAIHTSGTCVMTRHTHIHTQRDTHRPHLNFKKLPRCVYVIIFFPPPPALLGLPFRFCAFLPYSLLLLALNYTSACHYTHAHTHILELGAWTSGRMAKAKAKAEWKRPKREPNELESNCKKEFELELELVYQGTETLPNRASHQKPINVTKLPKLLTHIRQQLFEINLKLPFKFVEAQTDCTSKWLYKQHFS